MEALTEFLTPFIVGAASKYAIIITILTVIGFLRMIVKPLMTAYTAYLASTPSLEDDIKWQRFQDKKVVKIALFILDWLASVKFNRSKK